MVWIKDYQRQFDHFASMTRLNTLCRICYLGAAAAAINLIFRSLYFKSFSVNLGLILLTALIALGVGIWLKVSRKIESGSKIINLFLVVFIPLRVYQSGGIYSPVVYLYVFHCAFLVSIYGKKAGLVMLYWSMLSVLLFGIAGSGLNLLPDAPFYENALINGLMHIMVLLLTALFIIQLGKENSMCSKYLGELEKKYNIYSIMREYTIKTTPAISTALEQLAKEEESHDPEALFEIEMNLKKIEVALKALSNDSSMFERVRAIKSGDPI